MIINYEISTFVEPNGKIIHILASISAEAVNGQKRLFNNNMWN